jgi:cobalt/nickel-transporting P-type ATPase D
MEDAFEHEIVTLETDTEQHAWGACTPANSHDDRELSICDNSSQVISKNAKQISVKWHLGNTYSTSWMTLRSFPGEDI